MRQFFFCIGFLSIGVVFANYDTNNLNLKDVSELLSDLDISEEDIKRQPRSKMSYSRYNERYGGLRDYRNTKHTDIEGKDTHKDYDKLRERNNQIKIKISERKKNKIYSKRRSGKYGPEDIKYLIDPEIGKYGYVRNPSQKISHNEILEKNQIMDDEGHSRKRKQMNYYVKKDNDLHRQFHLHQNKALEVQKQQVLQQRLLLQQQQLLQQQSLEQQRVLEEQRELRLQQALVQQRESEEQQLMQHQNALEQQSRLATVRQQAIEQERAMQEQFIQQQALEQQRLLQVNNQQQLLKYQGTEQQRALEIQQPYVTQIHQQRSFAIQQPFFVQSQPQQISLDIQQPYALPTEQQQRAIALQQPFVIQNQQLQAALEIQQPLTIQSQPLEKENQYQIQRNQRQIVMANQKQNFDAYQQSVR